MQTSLFNDDSEWEGNCPTQPKIDTYTLHINYADATTKIYEDVDATWILGRSRIHDPMYPKVASVHISPKLTNEDFMDLWDFLQNNYGNSSAILVTYAD